MKVRLAALIFLALAGGAWADTLPVADHTVSGDEIALQDGRVVRLAGIKGTDGSQEFLQKNIVGHALVLQDATYDRYGRVGAVVFVQGDKQSVEDALLRAGLAYVYPAVGDVDAWLAEEKAARHAGLGYWAEDRDVSSDNAEPLYGHYGFVSGTVVKAERVKNKLYLNFGADWRTDFTVAIAAHDLRAFKKADMDPLGLQGKKIRVRGWVKRDFGPMMTANDPAQIEVLN